MMRRRENDVIVGAKKSKPVKSVVIWCILRGPIVRIREKNMI